MLFPAKQRNRPSAHTDLCLVTIPSGGSGACDISIWERENPYGELVAGLIADEFLLLREAVDDEALPLLRQEVHLPSGAPSLSAAASCFSSGSPSSGYALKLPRRVRGRAVWRKPQDGLRVSAPRARHGNRLPEPVRAVRYRQG